MIHWRLEKNASFFSPSISQMKSTQRLISLAIFWHCQLADLLQFFPLGLLFYTNSWSCPDFGKFCSILQFARLIRKQWRGLSWIITLYFPWFHVIFSIYGASGSNYLDIVIASFGFSFYYCRQWQVVSCWNYISTPYLSISRLALVNACKFPIHSFILGFCWQLIVEVDRIIVFWLSCVGLIAR